MNTQSNLVDHFLRRLSTQDNACLPVLQSSCLAQGSRACIPSTSVRAPNQNTEQQSAHKRASHTIYSYHSEELALLETYRVTRGKHHSSISAPCLILLSSSSEATTSLDKSVLPQPNQPQESKLAESNLPMISFSVVQQPPAEIRTNERLPEIIVRLSGPEIAEHLGDEILGDPVNTWAHASLVSADGIVIMAQIEPGILTGMTVARPERRQPIGEDGLSVMVFDNLVIHQPGYYRIHVALIGTSRGTTPHSLLTTTTNVVHVHAFAPLRSGV